MKKFKFTLLTASIMLAVAFTLSCSSDGGDEDDKNGSTPSSSSTGYSNQFLVEPSSVSFDIIEYEGQTYKTVKIGSQTWMAENLNYETEAGSLCQEQEESNCDKYGRLYIWEAAMNACPNGWHLPDSTEWNDLVMSVGLRNSIAGKNLKSKTQWDGTDDYGFSALPGGSILRLSPEFIMYENVGSEGFWWSATENSSDKAFARYMYSNYDDIKGTFMDKINEYHSVRCVKD